jgi:hypothetical protein
LWHKKASAVDTIGMTDGHHNGQDGFQELA